MVRISVKYPDEKNTFPNPSWGSEVRGDFESRLAKMVDDVLKQIFGQSAALIIYTHLEKNRSLTPEKIPEEIENFTKGLKDFLGSGALVIEEMILKQLYSSYELEFRGIKEGCSFIDYITKLKNMSDEKTKKKR